MARKRKRRCKYMIYGFMQDPLKQGDPVNWIIDRLKNWKPSTFAKPQYLLDFYTGNEPYIGTAKNAIMLWLVGEGLKIIGQGKWGGVAQKFAEGTLKGTLIATAAFAPALNPTGATAQNFAGAPTIGAYEY